MLAVFEDAVTALRRPGNDFAWSGWDDAIDALTEIEAVIADLRRGTPPNRSQMKTLFAPTGRLQEVSISSGWADKFLALASRFDRELDRIAPE